MLKSLKPIQSVVKVVLININIYLFLFILNTSAQDTLSQSWRNLYVPKTLSRIAVGYQKSYYLELGVTRRKYNGEDLFVIGKAYYSSIEINRNLNNNNLFGFKIGGEITTMPLLLGLETKYLTDFETNDFMLTPKIGLGDALIRGAIISKIYLCYGYNLSFTKRPFNSIERHQFSLVINPIILSYVLNKKNYSSKLYK